MSEFHIVIPARFASSRLPGKPLIELSGKPMIQHVYERAITTKAQSVLVATDDDRIAHAVKAFGGEVMMTGTHENGTERLSEVVQTLGLADDEVIVNVQGDEPLVPVALIEAVAESLIKHPEAGISSLCVPIDSADDAFDPNVVKVVMNQAGFALYFSRAPIGWQRDAYQAFLDKPLNQYQLPNEASALNLYRHIGMYGYRVGFLNQYASMQPSALERAESLEQLRALHYGVPIHMTVIDQAPAHGVDTPADVVRVEALLAELNQS